MIDYSINHPSPRVSGVATVWQGVAIATPIISVVTRCGLKTRRLPQFWLNTTNSTDTVATDDSDDRIRVRNHHDQPHEELKSNVTSTRSASGADNYNQGVSL